MATSDISLISARVVFIIGGQDELGSFDGTTFDDRFDDEEIERAVIETEAELLRVIAESHHPYRTNFLAWSNDLTNGETLPVHFGQIEAVRIKPYSASTEYVFGQTEARENIKLWRENHNQRFDSLNHDQNGSSLAGYFCLTNQTLEFTGYSANVKIFTYTPDYTTPLLQIENVWDNALVAGAVPKLHKLGVPMDITQHYANQYSAIKEDIRQGLTVKPEIKEYQRGDK